jgi:coproporphyrinogen III oxidase-like Fe-S oxidoreductase
MRRAVGLYVHLPFCASRCAYCTFVTSTEAALMPRTLAAVRREIESLAGGGRRRLASLYLGGGTPSLVPPDLLEPLLTAVRSSFELPADAFGARLDEFLALGLASESAGRVRLTPRGWLLSNELFESLC